MTTIGQIIRTNRKKSGLRLREISNLLGVDVSFVSKVETGDKRPTKSQVLKIGQIFDLDIKELMIAFLSDRLVYEIRNEDFASEALKVAESKIEYLKKSNRIF
jgi:transcriptional regulator with XRE-family HTH domain